MTSLQATAPHLPSTVASATPDPRAREWWRDALEATAWLVLVATTTLFLATGALIWTAPLDGINAAGRLAGLIATVLLLLQVALASRAPWIERAIGHDHALALHAQFGRIAFVLLLAHAAMLTVTWGAPAGRDIFEQTAYFLTETRWIALSLMGLVVIVAVVVTSVAAARRRWPYEVWHAIHLFAYVAVALSAPHQFTDGSTVGFSSHARWFWGSLYAIAFGSLLIWRVIVPVTHAFARRMRVAEVVSHPDGTVAVWLTGPGVARAGARAGQFMLWRFWTRDMWLVANPYSFSAAPNSQVLRITVRPVGDHSRALASVSPGTVVTASGPYGIFHHGTRTARDLVLVGAGVGVTPLRALLEAADTRLGAITMIVRATSAEQAPLIDELRLLAHDRDARLVEVYGPRGDSWGAQGAEASLARLVPDPAHSDVYVCGPSEWSDAVIRDAAAAGVPAVGIHREKFDW